MMAMLLVGFVLLLVVGAPIVVAMGLPAVLYFILTNTSLSTVSYSFYQSLNNFAMLAVPLFILMGNMVTEFGETERAFRFARAAMKNIKGYSSKICVVLSLIFAGMSGAAIAGVCGLGPVIVDSMEEEGYTRDYGAALTIAASTVGPIFPPSIPLVLYATIAQISSVKSLLAGLVPGIVLSGCLYLWVIVTDKRKLCNPPSFKREEDVKLGRLFLDALPIMLAPELILCSMLFGILSPGETGAMSVLYMLFCGIIHRGVTWKKLVNSLLSTCKSCCSILILMVAGGIFTKALMLEKLPDAIMSLLGGVANSPILVLLIINFILLILGMFMESNCALILSAPIILAITNQLGLDPLHIGVMIVLNLMIGLSTPPFGLCIYAVARVANVPSERVIKEVIPLYVPLIAALLLITFVPALSTWLPEAVFRAYLS